MDEINGSCLWFRTTIDASDVRNQDQSEWKYNMLSGVCIGTNDLSAAGEFYDAVLATIGMRCVLSESDERGYAGADGRITLFLVVPYNKQRATFGNGTQVMFYAPDAEAVRSFHSTALRCGGSDEGLPGPRHYHPDYYGAYVRDRDGNKLNVSISLEDQAGR